MRIAILLAALSFVAIGNARADLVYLTNGNVMEGRVTEKDGKVIIETANGTIVLASERVERIEKKDSVLDEYDKRSAGIDPNAEGAAGKFAALGNWCAANGLHNQALLAWRRTLEIEPDNNAARTGLGFVKFDGRWMSFDEAQAARGMVKHGEVWVTPEANADLERLDSQKEIERLRVEQERLKLAQIQAQADAESARRQEYVQPPVVFYSVPYVSGYPSGYPYNYRNPYRRSAAYPYSTLPQTNSSNPFVSPYSFGITTGGH